MASPRAKSHILGAYLLLVITTLCLTAVSQAEVLEGGTSVHVVYYDRQRAPRVPERTSVASQVFAFYDHSWMIIFANGGENGLHSDSLTSVFDDLDDTACELTAVGTSRSQIVIEIGCINHLDSPVTDAVPAFILTWRERYASAFLSAELNYSFYHPKRYDLRSIAHQYFPETEVTPSITQTYAPWGLDRIDQRSTRLDGHYNYGLTGENADVFIVDTGIDTAHPQLQGRAVVEFSSIGVPLSQSDCHGHGTHVAGIVGSARFGVAKQARLRGVQVLDCQGTGSTFTVYMGLMYILDATEPGVDSNRTYVINMSLGGEPSAQLDNMIALLRTERNVVIVVAAGNDGDDARYISPARSPDAITVSAIGKGDSVPQFANWGPAVDLMAPGVGIASLAPGNDIVSLSGTSMASPFVAGAVALIRSARPDLDATQITTLLLSHATSDAVLMRDGHDRKDLLFMAFHPGTEGTPLVLPPPDAPPPTPWPSDGNSIELTIAALFVWVLVIL